MSHDKMSRHFLNFNNVNIQMDIAVTIKTNEFYIILKNYLILFVPSACPNSTLNCFVLNYMWVVILKGSSCN